MKVLVYFMYSSGILYYTVQHRSYGRIGGIVCLVLPHFFAVVERKNYISGTLPVFHLDEIAYGSNSRKLICGTLQVFCDG